MGCLNNDGEDPRQKKGMVGNRKKKRVKGEGKESTEEDTQGEEERLRTQSTEEIK